MPHNDIPPSREPRRGLIVYLHGYDESPTTIPPFFRDRAEDGWLRLCPTGPIATERGFSWFDTGPRGVDVGSLTAAVAVVDEVVSATLVELEAREPTAADPMIVLGGGSQGAALAVAVAAVTRRPIAGLLIQAGFVPEGLDVDIDLGAITAERVLIQHGSSDEVVPSFIAGDLETALRSAHPESAITLQTFDHGHTTSEAMLSAAQDWMASIRTNESAP